MIQWLKVSNASTNPGRKPKHPAEVRLEIWSSAAMNDMFSEGRRRFTTHQHWMNWQVTLTALIYLLLLAPFDLIIRHMASGRRGQVNGTPGADAVGFLAAQVLGWRNNAQATPDLWPLSGRARKQSIGGC